MRPQIFQADGNGEIRDALGKGARGFVVVPALPPKAPWNTAETNALAAFPAEFPIQLECSNGNKFPVFAGAAHRFDSASEIPNAFLTGLEPFSWVLIAVLEGPGDAYLRGAREKTQRLACAPSNNTPLAGFVPPLAAPTAFTSPNLKARAGQTGWTFYANAAATLPLTLTLYQRQLTGLGGWQKSQELAFTTDEAVQYLDMLAPGYMYVQSSDGTSPVTIEAVFEV